MSQCPERLAVADDPPRHLISQVEYARMRGWSKQYVGQLVTKGRIRLVNGMVDPAVADAALAEQYDPGRAVRYRGDRSERIDRDDDGPGVGGSPQGSFAKARTVREHFRALRERLEYEEISGRLISKAVVEDTTFEAGRILRDGVLDAAQRAAERIVAQMPGADLHAVHSIIAAEIATALNEAADRLSARGGVFQTAPFAGTSTP